MGKMEGLGVSIVGGTALVVVVMLFWHGLHLLAPGAIPDIDGSRRMGGNQYAATQSFVCTVFTPADFVEVVLNEDPSTLGNTDSDNKDGDLYVSGGNPHDDAIPNDAGCNYHYVYYTVTGDIKEVEVQLTLTCTTQTQPGSGASLSVDVQLGDQGWGNVRQEDVYDAVLKRFEKKAATVSCP